MPKRPQRKRPRGRAFIKRPLVPEIKPEARVGMERKEEWEPVFRSPFFAAEEFKKKEKGKLKKEEK